MQSATETDFFERADMPAGVLAEQHRRMAEPGSGEKANQ
jgi:hypothetical protein